MIPETYHIADLGKGGVAIMPRPRGNDWLEEEIQGLRVLGYDLVVSFLERSEQIELELTEEEHFCEQNGIEFISFPIRDRGVPECTAFLGLVSTLHGRIIDGRRAIVHCRGGIGRAGITAASILIRHGFSGSEAFEKVSDARRLQVPDTEEQKLWVLAIEDQLRK
jgi:protein-tyrosine phosphatase